MRSPKRRSWAALIWQRGYRYRDVLSLISSELVRNLPISREAAVEKQRREGGRGKELRGEDRRRRGEAHLYNLSLRIEWGCQYFVSE
jgi:hypothetical protein